MRRIEVTRRFTMAGGVAAALASSQGAAAAEMPAAPVLKRGYGDGPYGQIHYRIVTPASPKTIPLMCLHPSPLSGMVYDRWLLEMGKDRVAFAPDTPGYGGSETPLHQVEIGDFAAAFLQLLDGLKIQQVDVMGYHTGSMTSVEMARRYPQRIRKVVLISAPNYTDEERLASKARVNGPAPMYDQALKNASRDFDEYRQGKGLFYQEPADRYEDIQIDRLRHFRTGTWGFRAAYNFDIIKSIKEVNQPVLLLNPEDDVWKTTPRVAPFIKNGKMVNLPGWSHGHIDNHTAAIAAIVRDHLDKS